MPDRQHLGPRTSADRGDVTYLLKQWSAGDDEALASLMPLVFDDLRSTARSYLAKESHGHTLQPTALVNEVYLRLVGRRTVHWENRLHFFGFAAQLMRRILVDHARRHRTAKRGDGKPLIPLDSVLDASIDTGVDMVALDDALSALATVDDRQRMIVELRFFIGLNHDEIAEILEISKTTVKRDWRTAKLFLLREMQSQ